MARYTFGGGAADWVGRVAGDLTVQAAANRVCTFWDAQTGGNQVTDLLVNGQPASSVTTDSQGVLPVFQGPDGVTRLWVDAGGVERVLLTTSDEGRYVRITTSTTWTRPAGVTYVMVRLIGAGGGGGGGGSASTVTAQVGGAGGGCGQEIIQVVNVSGSPTVTCTIGAGGNGGNGGAAGGNAGTSGGVGGTTSFGSLQAQGGGLGAGGGANSTSNNIPVGYAGTPGNDYPGSSTPPYSTHPGWGAKPNGGRAIPLGTLCGGSASASANATNGGAAGAVALSWPVISVIDRVPGSGQQPTADGEDAPHGATAGTPAAYGCGGAGGGGGAPGGRGGNGSPGGNGLIEIWW